ncbi:MAG: hypothetical protein KJN65_02935 [Croceitalea sp.]|nr:hypothetical protein [Croceitalea sp.]
MKKAVRNRSTYWILLPLVLLIITLVYSQSEVETEAPIVEKQRGAHDFGIDDDTNFQPLKDSNIEWVTMVPWGFQNDFDSAMVTHNNGDSLYTLEHNAKWQKRIEQVRAAGFKVFFKPHLWIDNPSDGKWRANVFPSTDENWEIWQKSYRSFIMRYAKVAEQSKAEMFCVGVEFSRLTMEKPEFWKALIKDIRKIYSGKLIYAANWYSEFENISFWNDLDYIGIQAYFPLVKNEYPTVEQISEGWQAHLPAMEAVHKKFNRQIVFTEMGYRSIADGAIEPWHWIEDPAKQGKVLSFETQANAYQAFFNSVWEQPWFSGVHIWQIRSDWKARNSYMDLDFSPQGKPAELIIAKGFE